MTTNFASGVGTLTVVNTDPFNAEDFILVGEMGQFDAELFKITSVNDTTGDIVLKNASDVAATTIHAHAESTKITVLPYDQIRFFRTAALGTLADEAPAFSDTSPLAAWTQIDPSSFYSIYEDTVNTTGFGWFEYKNTETAEVSDNSNPIPYAGFPDNTVLSVFNDFDSLLNVNELKLVSLANKFAWFNEGLAIVKNRLNLNNIEYTVSDKQTLSIVDGTSEYELPADFSDLVEIVNNEDNEIDNIAVSEILAYDDDDTRYYIRGRYIGFVPEPDENTSYYYRYRANATRTTSLSTYIILPDNMFYALKDWMLYRAYLKFSNPLAASYFASFNSAIDLYIQAATKRTANLDSWSVADSANA